MNRFVFGRGLVYQEKTDGDGADAGGGAAGGDGGGGTDDAGGTEEVVEGADGTDDAAAAAAGGKKPDADAPKDMLAAIDAGLGYKKGPNGEDLDPLTGKVKEAATKPGEKKPAVEAVEKHANGAPKKDAKGNELDDKGKVVKKAEAPKAKTSTELALTKEQAAALKPEARERFQQVITTLKAHEGTIAKQGETIKTLSEAREAIVGLLQETRTTHEQFGQLLEFNGLLQSGDPRKLEQALKMVEDQRLAIYKSLGREPEGGGIDLLAEFPDLKEKVAAAQITREDALEIAQGRRDKTARDLASQRQQQQQRQQTQTDEQRKQAEGNALKELDAWVAEVSKSDLDYKAKEDILLANVDEVISKYPAAQWLPTLKLLYSGIKITKAAPPGGKQNQPLRPSGAKPGDKKPGSFLEAINQGLGYATADKG